MNYVIIGSSAAAVAAVEAIRELDAESPITMYSAEPHPIYSRCMLSYYLAGHIPESRLQFREDGWHDQMRVTAHRGAVVVKVTPETKEAHFADGSSAMYDRLLIAAGGHARALGLPGEDLDGVFCLRNLDDAQAMLARLDRTKRAAVLGGGLIGLKAAYALRERGIEVSVLVRSPDLMSQVLDSKGGGLVRQFLEAHGVDVQTDVEVTGIAGKDAVEAVEIEGGAPLACEMVVVGKGVDSNIEMVAGTSIAAHWGIVTDDHMRTSAPEVWAAGDVAETEDLLTRERAVHALWPNASEQGRVAGLNMAGQDRVYAGSMAMNSVEFYGSPIMAVGNVRPRGEGFEEVTDYRPAKGIYRKLVMKDGKLVGLVLVGKTKGTGTALALIKAGVEAETIKDVILADDFDYAKILRLVREHPEAFPQREFRQTVQATAGSKTR